MTKNDQNEKSSDAINTLCKNLIHIQVKLKLYFYSNKKYEEVLDQKY